MTFLSCFGFQYRFECFIVWTCLVFYGLLPYGGVMEYDDPVMLVSGLRHYYALRHQQHQSHLAVMSRLCDISSSVLVGDTSVFVFRSRSRSRSQIVWSHGRICGCVATAGESTGRGAGNVVHDPPADTSHTAATCPTVRCHQQPQKSFTPSSTTACEHPPTSCTRDNRDLDGTIQKA